METPLHTPEPQSDATASCSPSCAAASYSPPDATLDRLVAGSREFVCQPWGEGEASIRLYAPLTRWGGCVWLHPTSAREYRWAAIAARAARIWLITGSFWNPGRFTLVWKAGWPPLPAELAEPAASNGPAAFTELAAFNEPAGSDESMMLLEPSEPSGPRALATAPLLYNREGRRL